MTIRVALQSAVRFLLVAVALVAQAALAANDVEAFAQDVIDRGLAILREDGSTNAQRQSEFHAFILPYVDARKTGLFALGIYRRGVEPARLEPFIAAFTEYSTAIYETRLDDYKNATLTVAGSIENKPGDHTVNTLAIAAGLREPVEIAFRVLGTNGNFKIVDIQVEGIWLSVELRDEFAALLSQNGGKIDALTSTLIERTRRMRAGGHTS